MCILEYFLNREALNEVVDDHYPSFCDRMERWCSFH